MEPLIHPAQAAPATDLSVRPDQQSSVRKVLLRPQPVDAETCCWPLSCRMRCSPHHEGLPRPVRCGRRATGRVRQRRAALCLRPTHPTWEPGGLEERASLRSGRASGPHHPAGAGTAVCVSWPGAAGRHGGMRRAAGLGRRGVAPVAGPGTGRHDPEACPAPRHRGRALSGGFRGLRAPRHGAPAASVSSPGQPPGPSTPAHTRYRPGLLARRGTGW